MELHLTDCPEINGYKFIKEIGHGGFSSVYLITKCERTYVAKVTSAGRRTHSCAFRAELDALMNLDHPGIIKLYDQFVFNEHLFLILEYCEGGSLLNLISGRKLSPDRFFEIAWEIVQALDYCHSRSVAHRDLKPENILFDGYGKVRLADFGISEFVKNKRLRNSSGTSQYMAPEVIQKMPNDPFAADIWSLGVMFATMLQGYHPFTGSTKAEVKRNITRGLHIIDRQIPVCLQYLIRRMLSVEPEKRPTIKEVMASECFQEYQMKRETRQKQVNQIRTAREVMVIENGRMSKRRVLNSSRMRSCHSEVLTPLRVLRKARSSLIVNSVELTPTFLE